MKPRRPKTVSSMGSDYQILFQPLKGLFGITDLIKRTIKINTEESEAVQKETLFHELYHVIMEECPAIKDKGSYKDREETVIRYISPRMFQLLRDNKKVRHYIFD